MDGRILAPLATAVGAVGIALLFATMAWSERNHPNPELDGKLALYDRYRAIVRFESRLPLYADGQDQDGSPELFMTGGTPAELSAKLTSLLNQIAQNHGVQVLRTSELTAREKQAIVLIGSEFEVVGQIGAIYAVLKNIDESRPFLVVDRFAIALQQHLSIFRRRRTAGFSNLERLCGDQEKPGPDYPGFATMRTRHLILLSALNAGLALTLIGLGGIAWISKPPSLAARPIGQWDPAESLSSKSPEALRAMATVTEALARPLFQRSRRPFVPEALPSEVPNAPEPIAAIAPPAGVDVSALMLKGLLILPGRKRALIATAEAPDGIWVEPGTIVSGWTVKSLDQKGVLLALGKTEAMLKLYVDKPAN